LTYRLVDTPRDLADGVRAYMDTLGLTYAALDFAIEKDTDRWVFLESNSSGQYGWLEAQTGAPITAAIADLLTTGTCPCDNRPGHAVANVGAAAGRRPGTGR
jgi:hypothetical protein